MKYSKAIKPISYLKTHASEVVRDVNNNHETMIITLNGEAKAVLQDIEVYEQNQESMALLKILAQSSANLSKKKIKPARQSFADIRSKLAALEK